MDLQRGTFQLVPLHLKELVDEYQGKTLKAMYADYGDDQHEALDEYLAFLLKEEFIYLSDHAEDAGHFIPLPTETMHYNLADNAIIDIGEHTRHDVAGLIDELTALHCNQIQVRAYHEITITAMLSLAQRTEGTECRNIEFIVPYLSVYKTTDWEAILSAHLRIGSITCYGAPENNTTLFLMDMVPVIFTTEIITSEKHCGVFDLRYFTSNQPHFLEALQHNTCLNRKIAVDKDGYIRNCPAMLPHYGHIRDTSIKEVLLKEEFRRHWHTRKDAISTCRDCEYRYVCTDCRAYLEEPANEYSKPLKCGYNPYTATWSDWAENPLKQDAITFYDLKTPWHA